MRHAWLLTCVALVGSASYWWIKPDQSVVVSVQPVVSQVQLSETKASLTKALSSQNQDEALLLSKGGNDTSDPVSQLEEYLKTAQGRVLRLNIEQFWQRCRHQQNCEWQLNQLQENLSPERFELVATYWQKQTQRDALFGEGFMSQNKELGEKIANVKAIDQQVWGQQADILFADQYAYYDLAQLQDESVGYSSVEEASQHITQRLTQYENQWDSFSLSTNNARYEQALRLIPEHFSLEQRGELQQRLAEFYLNEQERGEIVQRQVEEKVQAQQIESYQQALVQLNDTLSEQRKTQFSSLTAEQWSQHVAQKRYEFRQSFFANR